MSNLIVDDQSSRLKQFSWEELDENFFIAVIFRSGRRYVGQRHFEQQLFFVQSPIVQDKWRRAIFEFFSKSFTFLSLTSNESNLLKEIHSWHLNLSIDDVRIENLIDFDDLIECSTNFVLSPSTFVFQPMTTLAAASRTLELWKQQQTNSIQRQFSIGSIQIDAKLCPFLQEDSSRFLSVDFLHKENLINSSDDIVLRSSYVRIDCEQLNFFVNCFRSILNSNSSLIRLDEFLFRSKRLFFLRFLPSFNSNLVDHHAILSISGGLITFNNDQQRIPFLYIKNQKFFPNFNAKNFSTNFVAATTFQIEYLRLVATYEYLSTGENVEFLSKLSSTNDLILIPVENFASKCSITTISLNDFHFHEYQRRCRKPSYDESQSMSNGWWQTPVSSKSKRSTVNQLRMTNNYEFSFQM